MCFRPLCAIAIILAGLAASARAQSSRGEQFFVAASTHPIRYYLSLPNNFDPQSRKWPVLVCVAGANSDFLVHFDRYREVRGRAPFVVVAPCTFSNTNAIEGPHRQLYRGFYPEAVIQEAERDRLAWDEAGLLAILADLRRDFGADERIVITGFSGGGLLTYRMLLAHPERVAAAAPVCANYLGDDAAAESALSPTESATPVRIFLGEFDRLLGGGRAPGRTPLSRWAWGAIAAVVVVGAFLIARRMTWTRVRAALAVTVVGVIATCVVKASSIDLVDPQTRAAVRRLETRGFENVTVTVTPRTAHVLMPTHVVDAFGPVLGAR